MGLSMTVVVHIYGSLAPVTFYSASHEIRLCEIFPCFRQMEAPWLYIVGNCSNCSQSSLLWQAVLTFNPICSDIANLFGDIVNS